MRKTTKDLVPLLESSVDWAALAGLNTHEILEAFASVACHQLAKMAARYPVAGDQKEILKVNTIEFYRTACKALKHRLDRDARRSA